MSNSVKESINTKLLEFAAGLERIEDSLAQGAIGADEVLRLKTELADSYAGHIAHVVEALDPGEQGDEAPDAATLLSNFGVEPLIAQVLAAKCGLDVIEGWITYASQATGLRNPAGLVVDRLRRGMRPPKLPKRVHDRHRYISGKYADYIQS